MTTTDSHTAALTDAFLTAVHEASRTLSASLWDYWSSRGADVAEATVLLHLGAALLREDGWRVYAEVPDSNSGRNDRIDLVAMRFTAPTGTVLVEAKRLASGQKANALVEDMRRLRPCGLPEHDRFSKHPHGPVIGAVVCTTVGDTLAPWWTAGAPIDQPSPSHDHVGWPALAAQIRACASVGSRALYEKEHAAAPAGTRRYPHQLNWACWVLPDTPT
ncbi:MAG: hypothetical protein H6733_11725 [Alphaproteobacteria bacterium]|nr:hypothetical protein [Alphaproteobacteria bacterium]